MPFAATRLLDDEGRGKLYFAFQDDKLILTFVRMTRHGDDEVTKICFCKYNTSLPHTLSILNFISERKGFRMKNILFSLLACSVIAMADVAEPVDDGEALPQTINLSNVSCTPENDDCKDYTDSNLKNEYILPSTTNEGAEITYTVKDPEIVSIAQATCNTWDCDDEDQLLLATFKNYGSTEVKATAPAIPGYKALDTTVVFTYSKAVHSMNTKYFKDQTVYIGSKTQVFNLKAQKEKVFFTIIPEGYAIQDSIYLLAGDEDATIKIVATIPESDLYVAFADTIIITIGEGDESMLESQSVSLGDVSCAISGSENACKDYSGSGFANEYKLPSTTNEGAEITYTVENTDMVTIVKATCTTSNCADDQGEELWIAAFNDAGSTHVTATAPAVRGFKAFDYTISFSYSKGKHTLNTEYFKDQTVKAGSKTQIFDVTAQNEAVTYTFDPEGFATQESMYFVAGDEAATVKVIASISESKEYVAFKDSITIVIEKEAIPESSSEKEQQSSSSVNQSSSSETVSSSSSEKSVSSSSVKSSSSKSEKSSSSSKSKDAIVSSVGVPQFHVAVLNRTIEISGAREGSTYAIFDMQGCIVKSGLVDGANFEVPLYRAGLYMIRVGSQIQRVTVK